MAVAPESDWRAGVAIAEIPDAPRSIPAAQDRMLLRRHRRIMLLYFVLWPLALGAYYYWLWDDFRRDLAFRDGDPVTVAGEVIAHEETWSTQNDEDIVRIRYRYDVGGKIYEGRHETTDEKELAARKPGAPIPIEYVRDSPWASRRRGEDGDLFFGIVGLLASALLPPFALWLTDRERRRKRRLLAQGSLACGRVTERGTSSSGGKNRSYYAKYVFEVDGRSYRGIVSSGSKEHRDALAARDEVVVVHDPDDPSDNTIWGLVRAPPCDAMVTAATCKRV